MSKNTIFWQTSFVNDQIGCVWLLCKNIHLSCCLLSFLLLLLLLPPNNILKCLFLCFYVLFFYYFSIILFSPLGDFFFADVRREFFTDDFRLSTFHVSHFLFHINKLFFFLFPLASLLCFPSEPLYINKFMLFNWKDSMHYVSHENPQWWI